MLKIPRVSVGVLSYEFTCTCSDVNVRKCDDLQPASDRFAPREIYVIYRRKWNTRFFTLFAYATTSRVYICLSFRMVSLENVLNVQSDHVPCVCAFQYAVVAQVNVSKVNFDTHENGA